MLKLSGKRVISDIKQLTPERLTEIFKKKGIISDGKVTNILKKSSQQTTTSNVHFLELEYFKDTQTELISLEIAVKLTRSTGSVKLLGKLEVEFYNIIAETMNKMPIPICYDAAFSRITGWGHKILENLSQTHETISLPLNVYLPPQRRYCEMAIDTLAELHAFWWDHQKLKAFSKHAHVLYTYKENSFNEKSIIAWFNNQKIRLKQLLNLLGDRIGKKTKEMLTIIFLKFPQVANARLKKENLTVIHGDAHFWQFFYPKNIDDVKCKAILSDWMMWSVGVGGQDLAYMIGMFLFPKNRHMMEKELIKRYHNNLVKFGVNNFSWDECWYDYRLFNLLNIYRVVWWWSVVSYTLDYPFWWGTFNTAMLNIEDLNCMELLEGK